MAKANNSSQYNPRLKTRINENISTALAMTIHNNKKARTISSGFMIRVNVL